MTNVLIANNEWYSKRLENGQNKWLTDCQSTPLSWKQTLCRSVAQHAQIAVYYANSPGTDWAAWQPGTFQVGRLVRRPGGPLRQMLK